jgi:hypothetical protein
VYAVVTTYNKTSEKNFKKKIISCSNGKGEQFTAIDEITCRTTHLVNWKGRTDGIEDCGSRIMNLH